MKFVFALIILPALAGAAPVFTNAYVRLAFDDAGRLASLRENATGRELIAEPRPFVEARFADGTVGATALRAEGDALVFDIGARGCCRLGVTPFDGGWTFRIREANLPDAEELVFAQIPKPSCAKKKGTLSNIVMDETSAVVIRGYSPEVEMARPGYASERVATDGETLAAVRRENGVIGKAAGLSAGPRAEIRKMLKAMTLVSGATVNRCGGAWALDAEENRAGYLFATWMDMESLDDWLRLMGKAGTRTLHFHAWWKTRGHYEPDCCFPGGYDEMKKAVDCGFWNLFRYNPALKAEGKNPFTLDSKEPTADYVEFIKSENRYSRLAQTNPERAEELFAKAADNAKAKYDRLTKYGKLYE